MVKRLESIVRKVEQLSEPEQEAIAAILEAELEDEQQWRKRFAETETTLLKVAERARRQYDAGQCGEL